MVKPITVTGSPRRVTTTPAAPFTSVWRSWTFGRTVVSPLSACLATAAAPRIAIEAAGRLAPASIRSTTPGSSTATSASKAAPRAAGELPGRRRGPADHGGDLLERQLEHVVQHERQPLGRGQGIEHDQ